jgi:hypothetical protein
MQLNFATGAVLGGVDETAVEGARVDVEADGALVELAGVENTMYRLEGIDGAGMRGVHLDGVGGLDRALAKGKILVKHAKILDQQTADGDGHPTILVFVVVHGAGLADLPADGEQLIDRSFIDQVAGVVLAIPGEIGSEGFGMDRSALQECAKLLNLVEGRIGQFAEFGDERVDWGLFDGDGHRGAPAESITHGDGSVQVGREDLTTEEHRGFSRILLRNVSR